jgi:hypothetical protein
MKTLFVGNFNYKGEIHLLYTNASHKDLAKQFMIIRLAEKLGINPAPLRAYFSGSQDNFHINEYDRKIDLAPYYSK